MKCPHCEQTDLVLSERQGVEIDYCPKCRGVWLDRGELDKIVDRAAEYDARSQNRRDDDDDDRRRFERERHDPRYAAPADGAPSQHYKKRKSFWSELFD
jgi:Zn-finger nucleic acid-binding protein